MRRHVSVSRASPVCQICEAAFSRRLHSVSVPRITISAQSSAFSAGRIPAKRLLVAAAAPVRTAAKPRAAGEIGPREEHARELRHPAQPGPAVASQELSSVTNMITYLENSKSKVLKHRKVPSEADVSAALHACHIVADYITDEAVQPQIAHMVNEMDSTASNLLSLDTTRRSPELGTPDPPKTPAESISTQLRLLIDRISDTAYAVLAHPPVFITPGLLQQYVEVQARLGRPETLPKVFQLYASKPMAREAAGSFSYVDQNPDKIANAIEPKVVEKALDTAIEAKNLDAAVGIIESSYTTKAFVRSKLVRQAMLPVGAFAATPLAAYALATNFSGLQNSMDSATATNVAFAGILAYVGFTASIGVVALTTANDQMRRVTWAPGVPLRHRWIREEERAALDKVACAWGFQEKWRQGEEEGPEWNILREYIAGKGMVLDRTELMPGME
ncbi:hypothetical protein DL768_004403 [Monosporascus sp. mg162]|nr:hypothetical protein DL768_004403 [Monosporascus sp. mg162]